MGNKYISGIDPFGESFEDQLLWGETIMKINNDGTMRCIRFGTEEYEDIIQRANKLESDGNS